MGAEHSSLSITFNEFGSKNSEDIEIIDAFVENATPSTSGSTNRQPLASISTRFKPEIRVPPISGLSEALTHRSSEFLVPNWLTDPLSTFYKLKNKQLIHDANTPSFHTRIRAHEIEHTITDLRQRFEIERIIHISQDQLQLNALSLESRRKVYAIVHLSRIIKEQASILREIAVAQDISEVHQIFEWRCAQFIKQLQPTNYKKTAEKIMSSHALQNAEAYYQDTIANKVRSLFSKEMRIQAQKRKRNLALLNKKLQQKYPDFLDKSASLSDRAWYRFDSIAALNSALIPHSVYLRTGYSHSLAFLAIALNRPQLSFELLEGKIAPQELALLAIELTSAVSKNTADAAIKEAKENVRIKTTQMLTTNTRLQQKAISIYSEIRTQ